jgi:Sulfotransferase family
MSRMGLGRAGPVIGERAKFSAPFIALTYPQAGFWLLDAILTSHPDLACTTGTGLLPLCDQAIVTWQRVEAHGGEAVSRLGAASIRSVIATMAASIFASSGKSLWCEISFASTEFAEQFRRLYSDAKFICLHRGLVGLISDFAEAGSPKLSENGMLPPSEAYPDNDIAAIAEYWLSRTRTFLEFEAANSSVCLRVRYEDLACAAPVVLQQLFEVFGLAQAALPGQDWREGSAERATVQSDHRGVNTVIVAERIPQSLKAHVNDALSALAYPPLLLR